MADDEAVEVTTWQKRLEQVEATLAQLVKGKRSENADAPEKTEPKSGVPEPVQPPKATVEPPPKPTEDQPAPERKRGALHKAIFG